MPSPLARRRSPGADQPDCLSVLGEHYHEEPAAVGSPEQYEALFVCRMAGIVDHLAKRIAECRVTQTRTVPTPGAERGFSG